MGARIELVRRVAVVAEGGTVTGAPFASRRVQLVLAALATAPAGLSSRTLAARVWDELPPTWSASLRGTILALRAALEPIGLSGQQLVVTIPGGWALAAGVEVDVLQATAAVAHAEQQLSRAESESAVETANEVVKMISGELLAREDAEWIAELRSRLASVTDRALAVEAEANLLLARHAAAIDAARRLLERNPLDERAYRVSIAAMAATGDRAGAIRTYDECRRIFAEQLGADPAPETAAMYLEVLRSGSVSAGNLPATPRDGFFGRQAESALATEGMSQPGLVTIVGRGGVGKSRLALQVATASAATFPGGCFWVTLGDAGNGALVALTLARAVGAEDGADPMASIVARLAVSGPTLLVVDGCENATDAVAELLAVLLPAAPQLRVLATSRGSLDVPGEHKIELAPFDIPTDDADLSAHAAVQLVVDRLRARGQTLQLSGRRPEGMRQLVARCAGLPLALELASAQLATMAVADLLDLLPASLHGADQVVESLLGQSYDSLRPEAARLFSAWGVVEGALPLALATRLDPGGSAPGRVARLLGDLVDAGLLLIDRSGPRWRYRQDDQVRAFARARLGDDGARHALIALAAGLRGLLPDDVRLPPSGFRDAATEGSDGFRTVFAAAIDGSLPRELGLDLAFRMHRYWTITGLAEGRYWLRRLLDGAPPSASSPFALFAAGYLSYWAGETDAAQVELEEAARLLRGVDDGFAARALIYAAGVADDHDRPDQALIDVATAVELASGTDDVNLQISAAISSASILAERGDPRAAEHAARAVDSCRERGSADHLLATLATTALVCWQVGAVEQAAAAIAEAAPLFEGEPRIARATLAVSAAGIALADGQLEKGARLVEVAVNDGEELGIDRELPLYYAVASRISAARGRRGDAVRSARSALDSAAALDFAYPTAICLETVAELAPDSVDATVLRAVASRIRDAGDRPAPAGFAASEVVSASASQESIESAVARAHAVLDRLSG
ncbi:hypothetical protein BH11ACT3_BH11ACT3_07580 [soil metagenome]